MGKLLLRMLSSFFPLLRKVGINDQQLFRIVEMKLIMDSRRTSAKFGRVSAQPGKEKLGSGNLNFILLIYAGTGFFFVSMIISNVNNIMLPMIFFNSYLLFMIAMTLITDFSSVLMDTADNQIILPRPVTGRTLFAARMVHVFIYLFQFGMAICLVPVTCIFFIYGIAVGMACIVTSISTILLAVFLTYCLYMLVLRYASEEKLKDIITYFQIFMTIAFALGNQLIPALVNVSDTLSSFSPGPYAYLAPPVWMASALEAVYINKWDALHIGMVLLSIGLPPVLFWIMNKYLAPSFSRKMAVLGTDIEAGVKNTSEVRTGSTKSVSERLSTRFCRSGTEESGFQLTWKVSSRDKQFRLQFYPSMGYIFVFIFIFMFKGGREMDTIWERLPETNNFLWAVYMPLYLLLTARYLVSFSEHFPSAWVYFSAPVIYPGQLISGSIKAIAIKYFAPALLLLFVLSFVIWGAAIIDDFILGCFLQFNFILIAGEISKKHLPFSQQPNTQQGSGQLIRMMLQLVLMAMLIGLHYLVLRFPWAIYCLIPLTGLTAFLHLRRLQNTKWPAITL